MIVTDGARGKDDRRAFWAQKFADYRVSLKGYFRRRLGHSEDAEDLAQEVYMRLLRAESGDRPEIINVEAYLFTVAANLLREHALLRMRRGQSVTLDDVESELTAPAFNPEAYLDQSRREKRLAQMIDTLPPKLRAAIIMHYRDNMTYAEIAEKMNVTIHAVKKDLSRGLQACRRKIRKPRLV